MEFFNPKKLNVNFTGPMKQLGLVSIALVVIAVFLFFKPGPNYGIDFRGGVQIEIKDENASITDGQLRDIFKGKLENFSIQSTKDDAGHTFLLTANDGDSKSVPGKVTETLKSSYPNGGWSISKVDMVGPKIGKELRKSALLSIIYTCLLIGIYIWWRFDIRYAPGALTCILHDLIITIGILVLTNTEFSTTVVAALLTLAGYSINDTVVVFDRVREMEKRLLGRTKPSIINEALNSCLGRTIITSATTLISCVVLYVYGGEALRPFALTLFVGIIVGTYSSIYVACPLYLKMDKYIESKSAAALST